MSFAVRQHLFGDYIPNETRSANGDDRGKSIGGGGIQNWPFPEEPTTDKVWHADVNNDLDIIW
ncbi:hypothetical protein PENTCL1PPCAC_10547 [Pristionchus entomophagus]|uniref:Uncharacterized protein n=1 Tax=Pristionchus entomophagus TaxID=358040 RepID=A0AAV5T075_9BILA|nr:hypothetical protein PENTCL1PPCAC_10547 [Pristionchus entomophagus]